MPRTYWLPGAVVRFHLSGSHLWIVANCSERWVRWVRCRSVPWAPLLPLISIPFLLATLISAVLTPFILLGTLAALAAQL